MEPTYKGDGRTCSFEARVSIWNLITFSSWYLVHPIQGTCEPGANQCPLNSVCQMANGMNACVCSFVFKILKSFEFSLFRIVLNIRTMLGIEQQWTKVAWTVWIKTNVSWVTLVITMPPAWTLTVASLVPVKSDMREMAKLVGRKMSV